MNDRDAGKGRWRGGKVWRKKEFEEERMGSSLFLRRSSPKIGRESKFYIDIDS